MRDFVKKQKEIPARVEYHTEELVHCDKCGTELSLDDHENLFVNVLEIYLNLEQCVNDRVRMDLCIDCLRPIWEKICEAIGADPNDELRIGQD
jgi:hypothetical protein